MASDEQFGHYGTEVMVNAGEYAAMQRRIKALEAERDDALREKAAAHGLALGAGELAEKERVRADTAETRIKVLERGLLKASVTIETLADQQAMPDDFYKATLADITALLGGSNE